MKKIILLFISVFLCVSLYARENNPCVTEGNVLKSYKYNSPYVDLSGNKEITVIGSNAFCNKNTEELKLPEFALSFQPFSVCNNRNLKVLELNPFVQEIKENAFKGNSFEKIIFREMKFGSFEEKNAYYLEMLKALHIIRKSYELEDITEYNPKVKISEKRLPIHLYNCIDWKYISVNGVLFTSGGLSLVAYPCGNGKEEYAVPEGCVNIYDGAFYSAKKLKRIYIPKSVRHIGNDAFGNNKGLRFNVYKNSYAHKYCTEKGFDTEFADFKI